MRGVHRIRAEDAAQALIAAAQNNDEKLLLEILGPEGKQIVSSGDDAEDAENRANIVKKYQEVIALNSGTDRAEIARKRMKEAYRE